MEKSFKIYSVSTSYDEFEQLIMEKLKMPSDSAQSELFDLLGFENINFIEYIIEQRKQILAWQSNQKLAKSFACEFNNNYIFEL